MGQFFCFWTHFVQRPTSILKSDLITIIRHVACYYWFSVLFCNTVWLYKCHKTPLHVRSYSAKVQCLKFYPTNRTHGKHSRSFYFFLLTALAKFSCGKIKTKEGKERSYRRRKTPREDEKTYRNLYGELISANNLFCSMKEWVSFFIYFSFPSSMWNI